MITGGDDGMSDADQLRTEVELLRSENRMLRVHVKTAIKALESAKIDRFAADLVYLQVQIRANKMRDKAHDCWVTLSNAVKDEPA